ncbi:MAG: peptidylprolyl isomerase [Candidatus Krumholzibacteriaceae bacterium]|jgi:peptidyl-prolyl cis-trans isomerase SurA
MYRWKKLALAGAAIAAAAIVASAAPPHAFARTSAADTAAAATGQAAGGAAVVDRVLATVEDRAIMQSDVENAIKSYLVQAQRTSLPPDEEKKIREMVLNKLVGDALLVLQAEKDNIKVEDKDVDGAVDKQIEDFKTQLGGDDAFNRQLETEGLTLDALRTMYREPIRDQLLRTGLIREKIGPDIHVTDADVQEYYKAHLTELPQRPETVTLAHILIVPKPSDAVLTKAHDKITLVEGKLKAGGDFAELAKQYSDCPSAKFGGSLGTLKLEDLNNPPFEAAAKALDVGQVSPPVLTEFGYHIIKLEGVEGDQYTLRHILARAEATPDDVASAQKFAEKVRGEIVGGADFAKEAAQYSGDYATKNSGGVIPEKALEDLSDEIKASIKDVPVGGIAPVTKEARGFRVVKVIGRNPARAYSYDEAKNELLNYLENQKVQERLAAYIEDLKKNYSVVIKGE